MFKIKKIWRNKLIFVMEQKFSNIYFNIKTIINFSNNDHIKKLAWINENNNFPIFFPRNIPIELKKRKISRVPKNTFQQTRYTVSTNSQQMITLSFIPIPQGGNYISFHLSRSVGWLIRKVAPRSLPGGYRCRIQEQWQNDD